MANRYFFRELPAAEYFAGFRDSGRFMELCRQCPCFGLTWACPPLGFDVEAIPEQFERITIVACRHELPTGGVAVDKSRELMEELKKRLEPALLELEKRCSGLACAFGGSCRRCQKCTRPAAPCRFPELMRPSLEAMGFDLGRTLDELMDMNLEWARDGRMSGSLTLVGGLFHNFGFSKDEIADFFNSLK